MQHPSILPSTFSILKNTFSTFHSTFSVRPASMPWLCMGRFCMLAVLLLVAVQMSAQRVGYQKMSSLVRRASVEHRAMRRMPARIGHEQELCAFVRVEGDCAEVLRVHGCRVLAQFGQVAIASIPLERLTQLSADMRVQRIEAGERCSLQMDSTPIRVNALPVYRGEGLPQAYTGKGVMVGVQDVGFDLTHPTFYERSGFGYRICSIWDQLSTDTVGSKLYVGADYKYPWTLSDYPHSRDGKMLAHGTHTAGIAAGSGYDSPYRGMAFESTICLVSNAVTDDTVFIAKEDLYKYTSATDALGFKYIMDKATEYGMPCVVSFSEGSYQDFFGDDVLLYEVLDSLVGPGRIIVAAAGNEGHRNGHLFKPAGQASAGVFLYRSRPSAYMTMKADADFVFRLTYYHPSGRQVVEIPSRQVIERPDSLYTDTLTIADGRYPIAIAGYPNIYNPEEKAYELLLTVPTGNFGSGNCRVSVEAVGDDANVDFYSTSSAFLTDDLNPQLGGYDGRYCIHSPGSAPSVVCVGATSYRVSYKNYKGEERKFDWGSGGVRAGYSSVGPTLDGRIKPDVMAPGTSVVSAYNSFFMENNPDAYDLQQDVAHFKFRGRTYSWNSNLGTSMSTPVVSGAIALWLQANPRLTPDDVKQVFSRTCHHYDPSLSYPNNEYGYGEIDVYAGLLDVLHLTSNIPALPTHQPAAVSFALNNGELLLTFNQPLRHEARLTVWTTAGVPVLTSVCAPGSTTHAVGLSDVPSGVYVCQLTCADSRVEGSTLFRK